MELMWLGIMIIFISTFLYFSGIPSSMSDNRFKILLGVILFLLLFLVIPAVMFWPGLAILLSVIILYWIIKIYKERKRILIRILIITLGLVSLIPIGIFIAISPFVLWLGFGPRSTISGIKECIIGTPYETYYYPVWSPNGKIICVKESGRNHEPGIWGGEFESDTRFYLCLIDPNKNHEKNICQILYYKKDERNPAISIACSPNGKWIAYCIGGCTYKGEPFAENGIWLVSSDGKIKKQIVKGGFHFASFVSDNMKIREKMPLKWISNRYILYYYYNIEENKKLCFENGPDIRMVDIENGKDYLLMNLSYYENYKNLLNGHRIKFLSKTKYPIKSKDILRKEGFDNCSFPVWSNAGDKFAFVQYENFDNDNKIDNSTIWIMNFDRSIKIKTKAVSSNGIPPFLSWSPDDSKIAYSDNGIWIIDNKGIHRTRLTNFGIMPVWSPDGKKIAFVNSIAPDIDPDAGDIWIIDVNGRNLKKILNSIKEGIIGGTRNNIIGWSPNSTKILGEGVDYVWVINEDGSSKYKLFNSLSSNYYKRIERRFGRFIEN